MARARHDAVKRERRRIAIAIAAVALVLAGAPIPIGVLPSAAATTGEFVTPTQSDVMPVSTSTRVTAATADGRFVVLTDGGGTWRVEIATGERIRLDVLTDGSPLTDASHFAITDDGNKAFFVVWPSDWSLPKFAIRVLDANTTTVYPFPIWSSDCPASYRVLDMNPEIARIHLELRFGLSNACPIGMQYVVQLRPDGTQSAMSVGQLNTGIWSPVVIDDGSSIGVGHWCKESICWNSTMYTSVIKSDPTGRLSTLFSDPRSGEYVSVAARGTGRIYYRTKNSGLDPNTVVTPHESYYDPYYLYDISTGSARYLTELDWRATVRTDRSGKWLLYGVTDPTDHEVLHYELRDVATGTTRTYTLARTNAKDDLGWTVFDSGLNYAYQIANDGASPALRRISLVADTSCGTAGRLAGDTNCDGLVRIAVLGDSYISGEGAADGIQPAQEAPAESPSAYHACTDMPYDACSALTDAEKAMLLSGSWPPTRNGCHRTDASWAMRLAHDLATGPNILFAPCSGARTDDVIDHGQYDGKDGRPGPSPYGVFGGGRQVDALADFEKAGPIDLVLLAIGGNDVHFADIVQRCVINSCLNFPMWGWKGDAQADVVRIKDRIVKTLNAVEIAAPSAQVLVAGYPDPLAVRNCGATRGISEAEQAWLKANFIHPLNESIAAASKRGALSSGSSLSARRRTVSSRRSLC